MSGVIVFTAILLALFVVMKLTGIIGGSAPQHPRPPFDPNYPALGTDLLNPHRSRHDHHHTFGTPATPEHHHPGNTTCTNPSHHHDSSSNHSHDTGSFDSGSQSHHQSP